jgi:hypothetical protein
MQLFKVYIEYEILVRAENREEAELWTKADHDWEGVEEPRAIHAIPVTQPEARFLNSIPWGERYAEAPDRTAAEWLKIMAEGT